MLLLHNPSHQINKNCTEGWYFSIRNVMSRMGCPETYPIVTCRMSISLKPSLKATKIPALRHSMPLLK